MTRPDLHRVRRPFFDCTSVRASKASVSAVADADLHVHTELVRPLPEQPVRYSDIKVALRLAA